ncbi:sorting nexin-8-like [Manis javanica]|uniref:sorting nexin-8-like n=1 Tax=Manis javanica TaxID=9974 RepID=UPI003C6DB734
MVSTHLAVPTEHYDCCSARPPRPLGTSHRPQTPPMLVWMAGAADHCGGPGSPCPAQLGVWPYSVYKLRDRAEQIASRAIDNAADLLIFGKELSALGSDTTPLPSWAPLSSSTWASLKQVLKGLSVEFALLADRAVQQGKQEENNVVEKLNLFLDLLQSYKDLCERHEKGMLHRHQRALHKYSLMKRQMMHAAVQSCEPKDVEQLEIHIVEQENAIQTMELRNCFSLYCLHQEMQLVHAYLPLTSHILGAFVNSQIPGHKEVGPLPEGLPPLAAATEDCLAELADWGECRALKQLPLS